MNFAAASKTLPSGVTIPGRSYRLDGKARRFPGLPLGQAVVMPWDKTISRKVGLINTSFRLGTAGWHTSPGLSMELSGGKEPALRISGTQDGAWTIGGNAGKLDLTPGKRYRYGAWVHIDKLEPADKAPNLALNISREHGWLTNLHTPRYDTSRLGTWQLLEHAFVCPEEGRFGAFNIEKNGRGAVTVDLLLRGAFLKQLP